MGYVVIGLLAIGALGVALRIWAHLAADYTLSAQD